MKQPGVLGHAVGPLVANLEKGSLAVDQAQQAVTKLHETHPSALEMVDINLLECVKKHHPEQLRGIVSEPYPEIVLLCEYDDLSERTQKSKTRKAKKSLHDHAIEFRVTKDEHEKKNQNYRHRK